MKLTHVVYIFLLFVLASCSNSAIVSHHWAKYVNSNPEITNLSSSLNNKPVGQLFRLIELEENVPNKDSIVIVTKTGKTYKGIVSKSDYDGYFIKVDKNREIYISNLEIKSIQFIKNPTVTNAQSLAIDPTLDTAIIKTTVSREKVTEPSNNNSLENDVWDNTNSEFEISNSDTPKAELKNEEILAKTLHVFVSQHFFNSLTEDEQVGIIGHEIAHQLFQHLKYPIKGILNEKMDLFFSL